MLFHSRISSPNQVRLLPADSGLCITIGEASKGTIALAKERLAAGGRVMVDNGAFGLAKRGKVMTPERAQNVMNVFGAFAALGAGERLSIVAPDVIGDARATVGLIEEFAPDLRALLASGARVIVPVQGLLLEDAIWAWKICREKIGERIVAGIPSKFAAWSGDLIRQFVHETKQGSVHFLGGLGIAHRTLAVELALDASGDSGYAVIHASLSPGGTKQNMVRAVRDVERRLHGRGVKFFEVAAQRRLFP